MITYGKKKAPEFTEGFIRDNWYCRRVGVERFELPTSCSQSRLKILYKSIFTSVSVVEIEPIIYLRSTIFLVCLNSPTSIVYKYNPADTCSFLSLVAFHWIDLYPAVCELFTRVLTILPAIL